MQTTLPVRALSGEDSGQQFGALALAGRDEQEVALPSEVRLVDGQPAAVVGHVLHDSGEASAQSAPCPGHVQGPRSWLPAQYPHHGAVDVRCERREGAFQAIGVVDEGEHAAAGEGAKAGGRRRVHRAPLRSVGRVDQQSRVGLPQIPPDRFHAGRYQAGLPLALLNVAPPQEDPMCQHQPPCPSAEARDRDAARVVVAHAEQGWSLLCNGVIAFDDCGDLLPDGRCVALPRSAGTLPTRRSHLSSAA